MPKGVPTRWPETDTLSHEIYAIVLVIPSPLHDTVLDGHL